MLAIATPKGSVHAKDDAVIRVEAESDPIVGFEVVEVEIGAAHGDLSGVVEERGVESGPDLKAILRLQEERMWTAEPIVAVPAERIVPAKRRHQVEGHLLAGSGLRRRGRHASHQHAPLREKADELPKVHVQAREGVRRQIAIVVVTELGAVPAALAGVQRPPRVDLDERDGTKIVGLR